MAHSTLDQVGCYLFYRFQGGHKLDIHRCVYIYIYKGRTLLNTTVLVFLRINVNKLTWGTIMLIKLILFISDQLWISGWQMQDLPRNRVSTYTTHWMTLRSSKYLPSKKFNNVQKGRKITHLSRRSSSQLKTAPPSEKLEQQYPKRVYINFHVQFTRCKILWVQIPYGPHNSRSNNCSTFSPGTESRNFGIVNLSAKAISE